MTKALPRLRRGSAALVALTAGAAILAPGALGDNALLSTANPTLVAVDAISPSTVIACFDQGLSSSVSGLDSGFYLEGYTVGRTITGTAQLDASDSACADITFATGVDAKSYTLAVDTAGSVSSSSGASSNDSAVAVSTNPPVFPLHSGIVSRPQLAATGILPASGSTPVEVAYAFDEGVSNTLGTPGLFGFYTTTSGDTTFHAATQVALTSSGSNAVVAQFSTADQAILTAGGASDFVVLDGGVMDSLGNPNPIGTSGGSTELPDLVATSHAANTNVWSFTFNEAVTVADQQKFHVFDAGGIAYNSSSTPTLSTDDKTVSMQFTPVDPTDADPNEVTLETVDPGAVQSTAATPVPGAAGALPVTPVADAAGDTSGPDLTGFSIDQTTGDITYTFDKSIGSVPNPAGFEAVDAAGTQVPAPDQTTTTGGLLGIGGTTTTTPPVYTINGSSVTVSFATQSSTSSGSGGLLGLGGLGLGGLLGGGSSSPPSTTAATDAVGVIVQPGAVEDASSSDPNPLGSFGLNPAALTTPTNTNPTTTGATTTAAPTTPPAKPPGSTCVSTRVLTLNLKKLVSKNIESATVTVDGKKVSLPGKTTVINGKKTFTPSWMVKISLAPYHKTVTVKITAKYKAKVKVKKKVNGKTTTVTKTETKTAKQTHKYNPC